MLISKKIPAFGEDFLNYFFCLPAKLIKNQRHVVDCTNLRVSV